MKKLSFPLAVLVVAFFALSPMCAFAQWVAQNSGSSNHVLGIHFVDRPRIGVSLGLGNKTKLGKRLSISTEFSAYLVQFDNFDSFQGNQLSKIAVSLDFRLAKWLTFFVGPNFNVAQSRYKTSDGNFETFMNYEPIYTGNYSNSQLQMWCGAQFGFKFGIER